VRCLAAHWLAGAVKSKGNAFPLFTEDGGRTPRDALLAGNDLRAVGCGSGEQRRHVGSRFRPAHAGGANPTNVHGWSVVGGVQYQNLGIYRHNFGARQAEVDLSNSIFVTIGISRTF